MKKIIVSSISLILLCFILIISNGSVVYGSEVKELDKYEIFIDNIEIKNNTSYVINSSVYLPISIIKSKFDIDGFFFDENNKKLIVDFSNLNTQFGNNEVDDFIKNNITSFYIPYRTIEGIQYIPINNLTSFLKVEYETIEDKVIISKNKDTSNKEYAKVTTDNIKVKPSFSDKESFDLIVRENEMVEIIGETENYYKVIAREKITCYIKKKNLSVINNEYQNLDYYSMVKSKKDYSNSKINVLWEYVYALTPKYIEEKNEGIDVISPTWFYINDTDGNLVNKADMGYVEKSKKNNYEIWALITNKFDGNLTSEVLHNEQKVDKVIAQIMLYSSLYDLDGINVDFEYVKDDDRDVLTSFMRKLDYYMELQGLVLSIDITIPTAWSIEYDRSELSKIVDYIMVMTYDEHWRTGSYDGSIASYNWIDNAIEKTLENVDPKKLLMGIPLYTRVWEETVINGVKTRSNYSISMDELRKLIKENSYNVVWLDDEKQYYIEFIEGNTTNRVWIEDSKSIAYKLSIVEKYDIAGSACWRRGFEEEKVWDVFKAIFKDRVNPSNYYNLEY